MTKQSTFQAIAKDYLSAKAGESTKGAKVTASAIDMLGNEPTPGSFETLRAATMEVIAAFYASIEKQRPETMARGSAEAAMWSTATSPGKNYVALVNRALAPCKQRFAVSAKKGETVAVTLEAVKEPSDKVATIEDIVKVLNKCQYSVVGDKALNEAITAWRATDPVANELRAAQEREAALLKQLADLQATKK